MMQVFFFTVLAVIQAAPESLDAVCSSPSECELSVSLLQSDLRLTKAKPDIPMEPVFLASEDELVSYQDTSLLQMEVHLSHETPVKRDKVHVAATKRSASASASASAVAAAASGAEVASGAEGAASVSSSKQAPLLVQERASSTARALAWVEAQYSHAAKAGTFYDLAAEGNAIVWIFILFALVGCLVTTCLMGGRRPQDGNFQNHPLRPQGFPTPLGVGTDAQKYDIRTPQSSMTPAASRLPSQQMLNPQRAPSGVAMPAGPGPMVPRTDSQQQLMKAESGELPPICPSLILPHTEARFMIQMDHLLNITSGPVNILGTSGRKLLHALVCDSPDGRRCLMLASCGCEDDPRTCIFTSNRASFPPVAEPALEVFGKAGKFYGWLEFPGGSQVLLAHSGAGGERRPVLQIEMGNQSDLRMSASTMDGRVIASAGRNAAAGGRQFDGNDSWKMQVKPGTDAVLVTSCMLALILLRPWPSADSAMSRYSMGASSVGGGTAGTASSLRPHTAPLPPGSALASMFQN